MPGYTLKIPAGERDGRLLRAEEVDSGLACGCRCPGCGDRLVARNRGNRRRSHFAHHKAPESRACYETALHKMAKQILLEARGLLLPAFSKPPVYDASGREYTFDECHAEPRLWAYHTAHEEMRRADLDGRTPDVVLIGPKPQRPLLVEVRVTHQVDEAKIELVRKRDEAMMEIDLSSLSDSDLESERLRQLVLAEPHNREWIHCPHWESRYLSLLARIQPDIDAAHEEFARQQAAETEELAKQDRERNYARTASMPESRQRKLAKMRLRDQCRIEELYARHFDEENPPGWLMDSDPDAWPFEAHPLLWQLAIYDKFIANKPVGTGFDIRTLVRWVRSTFGCDERLSGEAWVPDPARAVAALMARMRDTGVVRRGRDGWYQL